MSVQQAAIHGAKSHLGPYAVSQGLITTMCTNSTVLKSSIGAVNARHSGAASSSSKASESELSLWESLIKGTQNLMTESDNRLFSSLIYCHSEIIGRGRSGWKRTRRAVTPSSEQISRATFSSRGSRKPDAAIIAKCYEVHLSCHLMTS